MKTTVRPLLLASVLLACACSVRTYKDTTPLPANTPSPTQGKEGWTNDLAGIDTSIHGMGNRPGMEGARQIQATSQDDLLRLHSNRNVTFTDPDNPHADIKAIDDAFAAAHARKRNWQQSYTDALKQARRSGKPVLIWFHDSKYSPASIALGQELLNRHDFDAWAKENFVRLRYDKSETFKAGQTIEGSSARQKSVGAKEAYIVKAFEHFNIKGTPAIVVLYPDGQRLDHIRGYKKGSMKDLMQRIKHYADMGARQHQDLKKRLEAYGYRAWKGKNRNEIFAQLTRYDQKSGNVWLREFDGSINKTNIKLLTVEDQAWLTEQQNRQPSSP